MAVAFSTHATATPSTGSSINLPITVTGTNCALVVKLGLASASASVTTMTWSLGGTPVEVKTVQANSSATGNQSIIWAVPNPTHGAGTCIANLNMSVPFQADIALWTGAHQTTPCPSATVTAVVSASTTVVTLTPSGLVAGDASDGISSNTSSGGSGSNPTAVTPNQRYLNATTAVNIETGDATGTGGITFSHDSAVANFTWLAVRIQQPAAGSTAGWGRLISGERNNVIIGNA